MSWKQEANYRLRPRWPMRARTQGISASICRDRHSRRTARGKALPHPALLPQRNDAVEPL